MGEDWEGAGSGQGEARGGGGESKEHAAWIHLCAKSRKKLILDVFLVVDYDSDLNAQR